MSLSVKNWKISSKILLISWVSIILLFAATLFYVLPKITNEIMNERIASNKRIVESALNIAKTYGDLYARNELPLEVAQKQALSAIKLMRYDNGNYLFVQHMKNDTMIMHAASPEMDGTDASGIKDPNGIYITKELARIGREKGAGCLSYVWKKPGVSKPVPKISYVMYYPPWEWGIVTGSYVDDINKTVNAIRIAVLGGMTLLGVVMLVITLLISGMITRPVKEVVNMIKDIAEGEGDLTRRINVDTKDEIGELANWFNIFVEKLHEIIAQVAASTTQIASASNELASTAEEMAAGSSEQMAQTSQVATSMEEMSATVQQVAKNSNQAAGKAKTAGETAGQGGAVVGKTVAGMDTIAHSVKELQTVIAALSKSSERIGDIVSVIDDVADQTNLLALNAAIEAARAGEQGRGFAVVADEVRKLAERTSSSTKEIVDMVKTIQGETVKAVSSMELNARGVESEVSLARQAGSALDEIVAATKSVQEMIQQIATAAEQQSAAAEEISSNVESIASVSKQNASAAQDTSTASQEISHLTDELNALVGKFKLRERASAPRKATPVHRTATAFPQAAAPSAEKNTPEKNA